ncbi:MAG: ThuA domain-containing protein [Spirochaetaceae bacterium]|jgi:trehalose utilization protein|nr:ThuA domain-containing protein [Spirochaetaceae bacterium]
MDDRMRVAVLVENHPYDVVGFQTMLDSFTDCETFVQPLDLFIQDGENKQTYSVVLWYNMHWDPPAKNSILHTYMEQELGKTGQGVVLLHHALLCFQDWDIFTGVCGLRNRGGVSFTYTQNKMVKEHIVDREHPITTGLSDFTVIDETYTVGEPEEKGNRFLITTDTSGSMKHIAWTRQYQNSRVFCYASGHDNRVYGDPNFRRILHRGLRWAGGLL